MHISEGVLAPTVLVGGYIVSALGIAIGLRKTDYEHLTTAAVLSALFFVASLIHVPLGPGSVHLILNGLLGLFLGWAVFPAIAVTLLLQAILFQYGGIAVLGVNTFDMAFPALLCHLFFKNMLGIPGIRRTVSAFLCGSVSVAGAAFCTAIALTFTDEGFLVSARMLFLAHIPVMIVEGLMAVLILSFIGRVRPELLDFTGK